MRLHGIPQDVHFLLWKWIIKQLQEILRTNLIVDEDTDIECTGLHVISFSVDEEAHSFHEHLKCIWIDLSERITDVHYQHWKQLQGHLADRHVLVDTQLSTHYIELTLPSITRG